MSLLGNDVNCGESVSKFQECKRDFEREIKNAQERAGSYAMMLSRLIDVADCQFFYNISDNETKRSIAAMIGAATLESTRWERKIENLIEEQELEQEK